MAYDTEKYNHSIEQKAADIKAFNITKYKIKTHLLFLTTPHLSS